MSIDMIRAQQFTELHERVLRGTKDIGLLGQIAWYPSDTSKFVTYLHEVRGNHYDIVEYFSQLHPWLFARALVALGCEQYTGGAMWPYIQQQLNVTSKVLADWKVWFYYFLTRQRLPVVHSGNKYVATILLHGAIPVSELREFADLLESCAKQIPELTDRSLMEAVRGHSKLNYMSRPIRRFVSLDGPEVWTMCRHIAALAQGDCIDDPVLTAMWQKAGRIEKIQHKARKVHLDQPKLVYLDDADYPLALLLPSVTSDISEWRAHGTMSDGREFWLDPEENGGASSIPIPHPYVSLELQHGDVRQWTSVVSSSVWLFEPEGPELREKHIRPGQFFVLCREEAHVAESVQRMDIQTYWGHWAGYRLMQVQIVHESYLQIESPAGTKTWPVIYPSVRAKQDMHFVFRQPVVIHYTSVPHGQWPECIAVRNPEHISYSMEDSQDSPPLPFPGTGQLDVDISSYIHDPGCRQVTLSNWDGTGTDTFTVCLEPTCRVTMSGPLEWPDITGKHVAGSVTIELLDVDFALENEKLGTQVLVISLPVDQSTIEIPLRHIPTSTPYMMVKTIRDIQWHWIFSGQDVINQPCEFSLEDIRIQKPQLSIGTRYDNELTFDLLANGTHSFVHAPLKPDGHMCRLSLYDYLDDMRNRGDVTFWSVVISQGGRTVMMARVHQELWKNFACRLNAKGVELLWTGPPVGEFTVTFQPSHRPWAPEFRRQLHTSREPDSASNRCAFKVSGGVYQEPYNLVLQHLSRRVCQQWDLPPDIRLLVPPLPSRFQRELFQWRYHPDQNAPAAGDLTEIQWFLQSLAGMHSEECGHWYASTWPSRIPDPPAAWIQGLNAIKNSESYRRAAQTLGIPLWPVSRLKTKLVRALQTQEALLSRWSAARWLLGSQTDIRWDYAVAKRMNHQIFGSSSGSIYDLAAIFQRGGQSARRAVLQLIHLNEQAVPRGWLNALVRAEAQGEWIGGDRVAWLSGYIGALIEQFPYVGLYWQAISGKVPNDMTSIAGLALLQRAHAYGMLDYTEGLTELAVSLPFWAYPFYDQQLFLTDLVLRVAEED